jgi:hypothetical protein
LAAVLAPPAPAAAACAGGGVAGGPVDALAAVLALAAPATFGAREMAVEAAVAGGALARVGGNARAVLAPVRAHWQTPLLDVVLHVAVAALFHGTQLQYCLQCRKLQQRLIKHERRDAADNISQFFLSG